MGLTSMEITIANPADPERTETVVGLIDTGAIFSAVPGDVLTQLGIRPIGEQVFTLADGSQMRRQKGVALFGCSNRLGGATVIFGEPGDGNLIGVTTLEALGLAFNPLTRELYPLPMILGTIAV